MRIERTGASLLPMSRMSAHSESLAMPDSPPSISEMNASDRGARECIDAHVHQSPVIARIQQLWRMRQRWHRAEKSLVLQGRAICRSWTNGDKNEANKLFDMIEAGDYQEPVIVGTLIRVRSIKSFAEAGFSVEQIQREYPTLTENDIRTTILQDDDAALQMALEPFLRGIEQFKPLRKSIEKELRKAARELDIWSWVREIKGFGDLNLAALVGECGDIGQYRNPSCVWKRMGLGVINGERQRKKKDAMDALVHGYNPRRRAVAYLLGDTLIKRNGSGEYRSLYLAQKEVYASRENVKSKAHAHEMASRYMVKRVLRNLWSAWRATGNSLSPTFAPSPAEFQQAAE